MAQPEKFHKWERIRDEEKDRELRYADDGERCRENVTLMATKASHRPTWLDGKEGVGKAMMYQEEPWAREERCSPRQTNFVVTLMMRKSDSDNSDEDYVPKHSREEERSSRKDDKPKKDQASKDKRKGKGLRGLMEEDNNPNWGKMAFHSKRAQNMEPRTRNVDSDARDKNSSQMAVPTLGGRINRGSMAVPEGAEMHSIRTPRGEGAFTIKRRRIQSFAAPSDGVIYGVAGEKLDGYISVEEKILNSSSSTSQPKSYWRHRRRPGIDEEDVWTEWHPKALWNEEDDNPRDNERTVKNYIEAKGTQPKGWPTVADDGRFFNDGSPDHDDDDICMVVKIKRDKGDGKPRIAYVDYVNGDDADQWKGPFTLDTSLETILARRYSRLGYRGERASSESSSDTTSS
jgi:hypothetical protein